MAELANWRNHHHGPMANHVHGVICHHTAGPDPYPGAKNDFPSISVIRNGRAGLAGPLAQYGLGWNGTVYIVSAGLSYHAGSGSWKGVSGNQYFIGIEAEDKGDGDWTDEQLDCYPRLVASICQHLKAGPEWVCGHKEYAPRRKIDPAGINMDQMRRTIGYYLSEPNKLRRSGVIGIKPPPVIGEDVAVQSIPISGQGLLPVICPVGGGAITAAAWISATIAEGTGHLRCFAQSDEGGVHDWEWHLESKNGHCPRRWGPLRDGVTQVIIHYNLTGRGVIGIETKPR
ncbi:MAG: N-acetylmuramoyl-L-alanine amidase [Acidobacteria bacterium]|nr:N-acetylmuramoyl-L-alanine amidase [Acidobacteriota bacterium]